MSCAYTMIIFMLQGFRSHFDWIIKIQFLICQKKKRHFLDTTKLKLLAAAHMKRGIFTSKRYWAGTVLKLCAAVAASWWAPLSVHYYGGWGTRRWVGTVHISEVVMIVMYHVIFITWWAVQCTQWRIERVICTIGWWKIHLAVNWNNNITSIKTVSLTGILS